MFVQITKVPKHKYLTTQSRHEHVYHGCVSLQSGIKIDDATKVTKNIAINQTTFGPYQEIIPYTCSLCNFALLFSLDVKSVIAVHKTLNILTHAINLLQIFVTDNRSSSSRQREIYNHGSE